MKLYNPILRSRMSGGETAGQTMTTGVITVFKQTVQGSTEAVESTRPLLNTN